MRNAIELGASLYVPAVHPDLVKIAQRKKLDHARSVIFCTEDAIRADQLQAALENLRQALPLLSVWRGQMRFLRVRNPDVLKTVLTMPGAELLDGFVLPKATLENLPEYLSLLEGHPHQIMPTLETREVFDAWSMRALCQYLDVASVRHRILAIRIGGNDLLSLLGMRRPKGKTIYQTPIGNVISNLVTTFKPAGFELTAPVFEYFNDAETLMREVREDLDHGLIGKTAVHPDQIRLIESCYKVSRHDLEMADRIIDESAPAVFKMHDSMCEPSTHRNWAYQMRIIANSFGIRDPATRADHVLSFPDGIPLQATGTMS
jgi:citrate lyase beta subunit